MAFTPAATPHESLAWPYSGFWRRVAATMVDSLILMVPMIAVGAFTFGLGGIILAMLYGAYFESSPRRATWGKQACGIQVETPDGEQLGFGPALGRQAIKLVANVFSIFGWLVVFLPAAFTERKQGLHDLAVDTVVRHEPGKGMPVWAVLLAAGILPLTVFGGILAAIAIPAYQDFTIRAKVVQARTEAMGLRIEVDDFFAREHRLPNDAAELGKAPVSSAIGATVAYRGGRIEIGVPIPRTPGTLYLTPTVAGDRLAWECSANNIRFSYLPQDCRR